MIECTIKELHDFVKSKSINLRDVEIDVSTRKGNHRILDIAITETDNKVTSIITEDNNFLDAHKKHLVFKVGSSWTPISKINPGDSVITKDGIIKVEIRSTYKKKTDFYDIQVDKVKEYYANGIVSHNSTLSDVIKIGFYGKAKGKSVAKIPNKFNKHGEIKLKFTSGNKDLQLVRKFEPTSLSLLEGKVPVDKGKSDLQSYLEEKHLNMPYTIFDNMVSLSLHDFKSFLKMKPEDKRKIIDHVFSMAVVNDMRKDVKIKKANLEKEISKNKSTLTYIDGVIKKTENEIVSLNEALTQKKEDKTLELKESLNNVKSDKEKLEEQADKLDEKYQKLEEPVKKLEDEKRNNRIELRNFKEDISLYDNGSCPTCGSDLTTGNHEDHKKELDNKIKTLEERQLEIDDSIKKQSEKLNELDSKISGIDKQIDKLKREEYRIVSEINNQTKQVKDDGQTESLQRILDDNNEKREILFETIKKDSKKVRFYGQADGILSEEGVKKSIIASLIPDFNNNIEEYLEKFNLPFKVKFNNKFESVITQFGEDVSLGEISLGQNKMFDFCVILSLLRILKSKYFNLNILFLDEIFSSLDDDNRMIVLKILKDFSKEFKINTFVINHAPLPKEYFDNMVSITSGRFSNLEYVEDF